MLLLLAGRFNPELAQSWWSFMLIIDCRSFLLFLCDTESSKLIGVFLQDHSSTHWSGWYRVARETSGDSPGASVSSAAPQRGATKRRCSTSQSRESSQRCRLVLGRKRQSIKQHCVIYRNRNYTQLYLCDLLNKTRGSWAEVMLSSSFGLKVNEIKKTLLITDSKKEIKWQQFIWFHGLG